MANRNIFFSKKMCINHLNIWLEAEEKIARGQSYTIGNRTLTRANLTEVSRMIELWSARLDKAENKSTGPRSYTVIPR